MGGRGLEMERGGVVSSSCWGCFLLRDTAALPALTGVLPALFAVLPALPPSLPQALRSGAASVFQAGWVSPDPQWAAMPQVSCAGGHPSTRAHAAPSPCLPHAPPHSPSLTLTLTTLTPSPHSPSLVTVTPAPPGPAALQEELRVWAALRAVRDAVNGTMEKVGMKRVRGTGSRFLWALL